MMKKTIFVAGFLLGLAACLALPEAPKKAVKEAKPTKSVPVSVERIPLPQTSLTGGMALKTALLQRRSRRDFGATPPTLEQIAQLLWAAQGITNPGGLRAAPSAGALYGLQLYLAAPTLPGLSRGLYVYDPEGHALLTVSGKDLRADLSALFYQPWHPAGAVMIVLCGFEGQIAQKYGSRGQRYLYLEAGHACQNLLLQATALDLHTGLVGAFRDSGLTSLLSLREGEEPLYVITIGTPP
jgi:SagB-type dehydrogenase family enzyme